MVIDLNSLGSKGNIKMYVVSVLNPRTEEKKYYEFSLKEKAVLFSSIKAEEGCICSHFMNMDTISDVVHD